MSERIVLLGEPLSSVSVVAMGLDEWCVSSGIHMGARTHLSVVSMLRLISVNL